MADVTEQTPLAATPEQRPKRKGLVAAVAAVSWGYPKRRLDRKVEVSAT